MDVRNDKKIIITTTFRDFQGNVNDKMQMEFLKSLKRQTYQNYILVVTIFKETEVEKTVKGLLDKKTVFYHTILDEKYRYSLSKVLLNGIHYGKEYGADILVDCSGDIVLQKNFLETVVRYYSKSYAGISHPNIFCEVNDSFDILTKRVGRRNRGIDIRFFDFSLISAPTTCKMLYRYVFYDWGCFEHFLAAIAMKYSKQMINVFDDSKVIKFENDREASNESKRYLKKSHRRNSQVLIDAARRMSIDRDKIFDLYYIHSKYRKPSYYSSRIYTFQKNITEIAKRFING